LRRHLHLLARQFDQAQDKAERVLEREPDNIKAHLVLGNAYAGQQQLDDAS
jgi:Tfp pilus assembly protein PilF